MTLLKGKWPLTPILALSAQDDPVTVQTVLARGAVFFISKTDTAERIFDFINLVLNQQIPTMLVKHEDCDVAESKLLHLMTPRQCEALVLLCKGHSNKKLRNS